MNLKVVRDAFIIASLKSIPDLKRQPSMLILMGLISAMPLFFILVFGGKMSYGLIGAMIGAVSFIGLSAAIQDITWDRYVKIREMIVAMPVHPVSYAMGVAIAPLVFSSLGMLFFLLIALWQGFIPLFSVGWVIVSVLLCWAVLSGVGFIISTYLQKANTYTLSNLSNILGIGLLFIPPVYYPEELLGAYSWVAMIFPTSNAASLIRVYSGFLELPQEVLIVRWLILTVTLFVSIVAVALKSKWREA